MKNLMYSILLVCLSFGLTGCGDDDSSDAGAGGAAGEGGAGGGAAAPVTCDDEACGGDLLGSWNLTEACTVLDASDSFDEMCPDASQTAGEMSVAGTIVFNEDGTFERMSSFTGSATINVPTSCLMGLDCAFLSGLLAEAGGSCVDGADDSCDCTLAFMDEDSSGSGTYTIEGNNITMVEPGDEGEDDVSNLEFCARETSAVIAGTGEDAGISLLLTR